MLNAEDYVAPAQPWRFANRLIEERVNDGAAALDARTSAPFHSWS